MMMMVVNCVLEAMTIKDIMVKLTCVGRWDRSCKEFDLHAERQHALAPTPPYRPHP